MGFDDDTNQKKKIDDQMIKGTRSRNVLFVLFVFFPFDSLFIFHPQEKREEGKKKKVCHIVIKFHLKKRENRKGRTKKRKGKEKNTKSNDSTPHQQQATNNKERGKKKRNKERSRE